jgi:GT2 family glycosyltransferase
LIDNGSTDGSVEFTRSYFPQVHIIENGRNLGWAAGNNVAIRYALGHGADYVVLLNNDMRVDPRWLTHAVAVAETDPLIGVVGFDTIGEYHLNADPDQVEFERRRSAWKELVVTPAEHVAGCALFLRADLLRDVGLLDERFFAYGEEDDLQKRARRAGYRSVRINIPLWHYNGGYWDQSRLLRAAILAQRNHIRVMIKNDSPRVALRRFRNMAIFVCWPGVQYDRHHAHLRRLRPSIYLVNVLILLYAILWNLLNLPLTLLARRSDEKCVRAARRRLSELQAHHRGADL